MLVSEVKKLSCEERFFYWIRERHSIFLRRQAGKPKPWTDDEVMLDNFFTNPYRENDKVTIWFRDSIRQPLRKDVRVLFATIAFRWFNLPSTGSHLMFMGPGDYGYLDYRHWDLQKVVETLDDRREAKLPIFTGAFMINSPPKEGKMEAITRRIDQVHQYILELNQWFFEQLPSPSLEAAHEYLTEFEGLGGFMAYEVVCDLRYTRYLETAVDINDWCNPGPGCARGLLRLTGDTSWFETHSNASSPPVDSDYLAEMDRLRIIANKKFRAFPTFEMREIEHSLCEWDKYERLLWGDGRAKRKYKGRE